MNQYVTGAVIRELREKKHMTQAELAEKLGVCDKTISKWEKRWFIVTAYCFHHAKLRKQMRIIWYLLRELRMNTMFA